MQQLWKDLLCREVTIPNLAIDIFVKPLILSFCQTILSFSLKIKWVEEDLSDTLISKFLVIILSCNASHVLYDNL